MRSRTCRTVGEPGYVHKMVDKRHESPHNRPAALYRDKAISAGRYGRGKSGESTTTPVARSSLDATWPRMAARRRPSASSGGQRREKADLRGVKTRTGLTRQREGAPCPGGVRAHNAQLVVETYRSAELAIAEALFEITSGRVAEAGGASTLPSQDRELVEIRLAKLDLDEPLQHIRRPLGQRLDVPDNFAGGKQGRRIDG
jgi:hypothetical protein